MFLSIFQDGGQDLEKRHDTSSVTLWQISLLITECFLGKNDGTVVCDYFMKIYLRGRNMNNK